MIKIKNKEKKDLTLLFGLAWELSPFVKVPSSTIFSLADKDLGSWEARFSNLRS